MGEEVQKRKGDHQWMPGRLLLPFSPKAKVAGARVVPTSSQSGNPVA